jgi:hypothetical protein
MLPISPKVVLMCSINAFRLVHLSGDGDDYHRQNKDEDGAFVDDRLPRNFVPFNVQVIANNIVVTYVLHREEPPFETDGHLL